ncbi:ATP-binding cassette domain-containing protein [Pontibacillus yanchengensis]|uniref:ATP-binding cassette domain-containing protein n=1 Tax=Pontibacillus yanchengensis TaxID=462910 RepID=A0A6I5A4R9_9BACI|nr:ATP-binding cassette domain-containing protein [Pontibacillus yanchengensis]MYL35299.1 ATP-binding cassette domain-containing protein [Pontibacillus yanchengensis]
MRVMHAKQIHFTIGDRTLLEINELSIHQGDRIGLIGKNGEGKSLLLNYLLGLLDTNPLVSWNGSVGYFRQLNIEEEPSWNHLSGGEKTLRKLEQLFNESHDILLLDEPTNNLDWQRIDEVEKKLLHLQGAYVIVSHDRKLLDEVCTKIWELEDGEVTEYKGNYSDYEDAKALKVQHQQEEYEAYVKEKKRLTERMHQKEKQSKGMNKPPSRMGNSEWQLYKGKASGKKQKVERVSKVIQDRIDRLEKVEKPFEWSEIKMDYTLVEPIHRKNIFVAKDLTMNIGNRQLYTIDHVKLKTGSKTAIIGANGSGKTTLLHQLLYGNTELEITNQASIGHFDQTLEALPEDKTILEYVQENSSLSQHVIRIILGRLRFFDTDVHKKIGILSGGERVKAALARLLTGSYNVLVIDEPTNHLDIEAITSLEGLIQDYPGTVLFVTHDRRFIEETADHLWFLENGSLTTYQGTLNNYYTDKQKTNCSDDTVQRIMTLENKLTELISRLSIPGPKNDNASLEEEYEETLHMLKELKKQ